MNSVMNFIDQVMELFAKYGDRVYLGEAVTQREHALQAATLAEKRNGSANQIAAALLHDIGHIINASESDAAESLYADNADDLHEEIGFRWLSAHFGPEVSDPVRLHVPAKRYLCAVDEDYINVLSKTSVRSLHDQGGPMSSDEVKAFESEPYATDAVAVRRWDDGAKVPNLETPDLTHFRAYLDTAFNNSAHSSA